MCMTLRSSFVQADRHDTSETFAMIRSAVDLAYGKMVACTTANTRTRVQGAGEMTMTSGAARGAAVRGNVYQSNQSARECNQTRL